jgi:hypothetical protein
VVIEQTIFFRTKNTIQQAPENKCHSLLADPPEIDISKISEDANKKKVFVGFSAIAFATCMRY